MNNILCFVFAAVTKSEQATHYRRLKKGLLTQKHTNIKRNTKSFNKANQKLKFASNYINKFIDKQNFI